MSSLNILHGCCTIQLTRGLNTLIDESDSATIGCHKWKVRPRKKAGRFYVVRAVSIGKKKQRGVFLHRVLLDAPSSLHVDHRNGDELDNRRENLRVATSTQNTQNTRCAVGVSRFKGVARAGAHWRARIRVNGALLQLGCHRTEEQAARAYDTAAREHFGEFACTNVDIHGDY